MADVKGLSLRRRTDTFENIELSDANGQQQPVDPSAGVAYAWRDLNVYAGGRGLIKKSPEVHILKNVSGLCEGGQLLAIMGASGAGKTTLLNVLTFRTSKLRITGDIYINGRPVDMRTIAGVSAYVQQEDLFTGVFTVREQLNFNAQLRIGKEVSQKERLQRVEEVIKELGLGKCANTKIGIPGRIKGISGGEKKRLAFACEMITNPLLLLATQPHLRPGLLHGPERRERHEAAHRPRQDGHRHHPPAQLGGLRHVRPAPHPGRGARGLPRRRQGGAQVLHQVRAPVPVQLQPRRPLHLLPGHPRGRGGAVQAVRAPCV
nr:protein white-like [Penaeus vannamei]